jgi:hypothetical protein
MMSTLFRWFPSVMALLAFTMFGLITQGLVHTPANAGWRGSPTGLFLAGSLFVVFQIAVLLVFHRRPPLSAEQRAAMTADRHREIAGWLQRRLSRDEAIADLLDPAERLSAKEIEQMTAGFDEWYASADGPNRELWLYSTDDESWENLCGERGFAIVADGWVTDFYMTEMN